MKYIFFIVLTMIFFASLKRRFRRISVITMLVVFLALLLIYPQISLNAAKEGIELWLFIVIPSLLPFFIINDMLTSLRVPENIAVFFKPIARSLFGTSGYGAYVFIMSIFAGYPAGARIIAQLIEEKKISDAEGQKILTFSSTSGPLFIIGAVGSGMLKSGIAGYILYASHILGAVLNGILLRLFFRNKIENEKYAASSNLNSSSSGDILSRGIMTSLITSGFIGGYIILFSVIITLLNKVEFFGILNSFFTNVLQISLAASSNICSLLKSSIEISNGSKILCFSSLDFDLKLIFLSFIIAFSSLSVIGQVSSVLNKTKISMKAYVACKVNHGILSSLICYALLKVNLLNVKAYNTVRNPFIPDMAFVLIILLILLLVFNILGSAKCRKR